MSEFALITGASSGIGLELAKLFARDKIPLILVARGEARLSEVAEDLRREYGVDVRCYARDLSERGAAQELCEHISRDGHQVGFLVNNAGFGLLGKFAELSLDEQLAMLELNCGTLTVLSWHFARQMRERRFGRILNVASTAAFQPGPLMAVYYASKSYVLSLSEALRNEHRGTGVTVTCLCPGPTPTEFQARAGNRLTGLFRLAATSAESVAQEGYRGMLANRSVVVPGLVNKLLALGTRFAPRDWVTAISRRTAEQD
ncbi:MAG: SDR family oxidoreductase [Calditrichaeota bacterium]|nr:SDR family oxidoreductase [Calditrichota bacterium]MCB9365720.1 SDR family oxidoreductase [Calditrichota bacterium]